MALTTHCQNAKSNGQVGIFFLHLIFLLLIMALFLLVIELIGGKLSWFYYSKYYVILIPLTVILPVIVATTTAFSYKKVLLTISPASHVNQEKIMEFFYKEAYKIVQQDKSKVVFERSRFLPRFLCLNVDKPYVEVTPTEVRIYMLKRLSLVLTPQLQFGKRFEINPESTAPDA